MREFIWDQRAIDTLCKMRQQNESFTTIGSRLGVSRNAAIGKAHRLGMFTEDKGKSAKRQAGSVSRTKTRLTKPKLTGEARLMRQRELSEQNEAKRAARAKTVNADTKTEEMRESQVLRGLARNLPDWANTPLAGTRPVSLVNLNPRSCRWPIDTSDGLQYCGCETPKSSLSYCPGHSAISASVATRTPDQVRMVDEIRRTAVTVNSQP